MNFDDIKVTFDNNIITFRKILSGDTPIVTTTINLITNTIEIKVINDSEERIIQSDKLDIPDIYLFSEAISYLSNNDSALYALIDNDFYMHTFCPYNMSGSEITGKKSLINSLFVFSNLIIPEQYFDDELFRVNDKPEIVDKLKKKFFEKNSKFVYYFKKVLRLLLLIPGLVLSPIIILVSIFALSKMT